MDVILVIDQGTTGSQIALFNAPDLSLISNAKVEYPQQYPVEGWVEHDLEEIWHSVSSAFEQATLRSGIPTATLQKRLLCLGVTNQRETVCAWDRTTGKPLGHAIVWQDRRTAARCQEISGSSADTARIEALTGLVVDPYFSATKMQWILENNAQVRAAAQKGTLALGTIDSFLIHRLTGGQRFVSDHSNASRTMLYNLSQAAFDTSLCEFFKVPPSCLPELAPSCGKLGVCKGVGFLPDGLPITGCLGDQQSSLFGHGAISPGEGKITFGTGSFLLAPIDSRPEKLPRGLLCSVAFHDGSTQRLCVEGSVFIAAAALQYLRDQFGWLSDSAQSESLSLSVERMPGLVVIPAFAGLGAPFWNPNARASIMGMSLGTKKEHVIRATLESIAHQNVALASLMSAAVGRPITRWGIDGGAANNNFLMQFQADVLQVSGPVTSNMKAKFDNNPMTRVTLARPPHSEITALGAAKAAWFGISGLSPLVGPSSVSSTPNADHATNLGKDSGKNGIQIFSPEMPYTEASALVSEWQAAAAAINQFYSK